VHLRHITPAAGFRRYVSVMARPLRLEFSGALYHVTARGDHGELIYRDDSDRYAWLETVELVCKRFNILVHAYCQMTNHYHMLVETNEGNLSQAMRQLNGIYTQRFNRRHDLVGHLFQGRYKAILVQKESYLLELIRYVVLNPIRAGIVPELALWAWSSHFAMVGKIQSPAWLNTDWILSQFGPCRSDAIAEYDAFVMQGNGIENPLKNASHRLILGDEAFVGRHRGLKQSDPLKDVSRTHRRAVALSLAQYETLYEDKAEAMARAYHSTAFTMEQIGAHFGVSARSVNRALRKFEI
jgi:putative transposase